MLEKLFTYLKKEQEFIDELIELAKKQQRALISSDMGLLEEVTRYQEALAKGLQTAENQRIKYLTATLGISNSEALSLKLSSLKSEATSAEELERIRLFRNEMKEKMEKFHEMNITNRMLTNRAMSNVREILALFSRGGRKVCNVRV